MDAITVGVIALCVLLVVVFVIDITVTWSANSEARERQRVAERAEIERAELKAAMLRFQAETNSAAHEARKALILEALRFGQRAVEAPPTDTKKRSR